MILTIYTLIHVVISLVGIASGFIVLFGMFAGKRLDGWTSLFLITTVLTSVTGFFFPFHGFKPSYVVGILSLLVLAVAIYARYSRHLAGASRVTYVITAMIALWFNSFVGVVQAFKNVPALHAMAPTQTEPAFKLTQLAVLALFVVLTIVAAIKFHPAPAAANEEKSMDGLTTIQSDFGPEETMERLQAEVIARGMKVFARINHSALAAEAGMELAPTDLLIFGNPKGGTPLMQAAQTIGIDLPLKALVWQDAQGGTWLSYNEPVWLAKRHGLEAGTDQLTGMLASMLGAVASKAAK